MASLFGKVAAFARSPKGQQIISQASSKAKQAANDPKTRAKIDQGTAKVRQQVAKRRGGASGAQQSGTTYPPDAAGPAGNPGTTAPGGDDVAPR